MNTLDRPRIGVVNFLNAYPLWCALEERSDVALYPGVPSRLAAELNAGNLDAALISSVEYLRHRTEFTYHPGLCIAAQEESCSIRLFTPEASQPFGEALRRLRRVYTDQASRSSVAQLRVLLHELALAPPLEEIPDAAERIPGLSAGEALLAIGDTALRFRHEPSYDVQSEYFKLFHRGFVYALWVYRPTGHAALEGLLSAAYEQYTRNQDAYLAEAIRRFGFEAGFTRRYLTEVIQHTLGADRLADLEFFSRKNI